MLVSILLENDDEFEFEANLSFRAGTPGRYSGPPELCFPAEPDEAEFLDYGPFYNMYDAVLTACWMFECPMSESDIARLASTIEEETITKFLENPPTYEPDCDDYESWDD
jgi:hypothetical protein